MTKSSAIFLQLVVVLLGLATLAFMLWEPHIEGRNANATIWEVYFHDPFLAYAYCASIFYFVALYQAFRVLGYASKDQLFMPQAVQALRTIRLCAIVIVCFVVIGEFVFILPHSDDRPPGVVMGVFVVFVSSVIVAVASMFERTLQNAVDLKSENDLTV